MKKFLYIILMLTVAPGLLFMASCGGDTDELDEPGGYDDGAEVETGENGSVTEQKDAPPPAEPEPKTEELREPFVFTYDFAGKTTKLPAPSADKLPSSWKGFNLLNMFIQNHDDRPFEEIEFKMISDLGFTFVRLPMDYRIWTKPNDWNQIDESQVRRIDQALEYGIKYDIHICLNFHRAPGYTVASPPERTNLWTDEESQEAFANLWAFLAARYKNVPNEYLSFNFVNEPADVDEEVYAAIIRKVADAIWEQDPKRLLISDGLEWGNKPSYLIKEMGIAQATRGYAPFNLTHYKAEWAEGAENYPLPSWPTVVIPRHLYSVGKTDMSSVYSPYIIEHDFNEAYYLDVNVGIVSNEARFVVKAGDDIIYEKLFRSGQGEGEWTKEVYVAEWNVYQNIFDKDYRVEIPAGTKLLTLDVTGGDWMTINDMKFTPAADNSTGKTFSLTPNSDEWGLKIPAVKIGADGEIVLEGTDVRGREWLRQTNLTAWEELMANGGGAIVGEWGSYNKTPHDVVLRWMEDCLENFKNAGMGWALWNFNASFGILDSYRADVEYEDYNGYKLDRKMLDLLLKYLD